jgi:hypothetical protein
MEYIAGRRGWCIDSGVVHVVLSQARAGLAGALVYVVVLFAGRGWCKRVMYVLLPRKQGLVTGSARSSVVWSLASAFREPRQVGLRYAWCCGGAGNEVLPGAVP